MLISETKTIFTHIYCVGVCFQRRGENVYIIAKCTIKLKQWDTVSMRFYTTFLLLLMLATILLWKASTIMIMKTTLIQSLVSHNTSDIIDKQNKNKSRNF